MGHLHNGDGEYDFTVGAYIAREIDGNFEVLLHMHRKLGKLLPLGGHVELNESPWSAVARELAEEAGYVLSDLYVLQPKDSIKALTNVTVQPQPLVIASYDYSKSHNHTDMAFVFIEKNPPSNSPNHDESLDFRWLNSQELDEMTAVDLFPNTKEIYIHILEKCVNEWEKMAANSYIL